MAVLSSLVGVVRFCLPLAARNDRWNARLVVVTTSLLRFTFVLIVRPWLVQVSQSPASADLGSTRTLRMLARICWSLGMASWRSMVDSSLSQGPSSEPLVGWRDPFFRCPSLQGPAWIATSVDYF